MKDTTTLTIEGMDCPSCTSKIEGAVCQIPGVQNVRLNYTNQKLHFEGADEASQAVKQAVERLGYKVRSPGHETGSASQEWWQTGKGGMVILTGAMLGLAFLLSFILPRFADYAFLIAALVALVPLVRKAWAGALAGQPFTIETLVSLAVVGAIGLGEIAEAAVVVFFFLVGELLEMVAAGKARKSVQALADLVPKTAFLVEDGKAREVDAAQLTVGDLIEVRPGDRVPADGVITEGNTAVDLSAVTGESVPRRMGPGDEVFAGAINADGAIRLRVEAGAENNMIARIMHLVEEAEASKAPTARFIERFSRWYTPGVIAVSGLIMVLPPLLVGASWEAWVYKGLAILLIGCPCALVLSPPAAITSGISAGARQGL
ncbi:MAG TPA: heavy metal translocating P-type ATPase, partial [Rhodobacteraceae bacterium]|nr:heavy metal translocating P-type ATPase [Paracoccaceae bacterium]